MLGFRRSAFPRRCSVRLRSGHVGPVGVRACILGLSLICAFTPVNSPGGAIVPGPKKATAHSPDWTTKCIAHGAFDSKCIAFTFDDGPNPAITPRLLDLLRNYWRSAHPKLWLFPGDVPGQPITIYAVEQFCRKVRQEANFAKPVTPHALSGAD